MHAQKGLLSDSFKLPWKLTSHPQLHCAWFIFRLYLPFTPLWSSLFPEQLNYFGFVEPKTRQLAGPNGYLTRKLVMRLGQRAGFPFSLPCSFQVWISSTAVQLTPKQTVSALRRAVGEWCQGRESKHTLPLLATTIFIYCSINSTTEVWWEWGPKLDVCMDPGNTDGDLKLVIWAYCLQTQEKDLVTHTLVFSPI